MKGLFFSGLLMLTFILVMVLSPIIFVLNILRKLFREDDLYSYMKAVLIGFDQIGGSLLYGTKDWTISSYTYILHNKGVVHATYFMRFINWLWYNVTKWFKGKGTRNHCEGAYYKEIKQHQNGGV